MFDVQKQGRQCKGPTLIERGGFRRQFETLQELANVNRRQFEGDFFLSVHGYGDLTSVRMVSNDSLASIRSMTAPRISSRCASVSPAAVAAETDFEDWTFDA